MKRRRGIWRYASTPNACVHFEKSLSSRGFSKKVTVMSFYFPEVTKESLSGCCFLVVTQENKNARNRATTRKPRLAISGMRVTVLTPGKSVERHTPAESPGGN
jgi:hypothetical protein